MKQKHKLPMPIAIAVGIAVLAFTFLYTYKLAGQGYFNVEQGSLAQENNSSNSVSSSNNPISSGSNFVSDSLDEEVISEAGVVLPVVWGDLGKKMTDAGVIDADKFEKIYAGRGGLTKEEKDLLYGVNNGNIKITPENAPFVLNMLWALGLGNKNDVLEKGPMMDPQYGGAGNFASTGGWTLAKGGAMDHYSKHNFINLTAEQQKMVERISQNIYRPCCGNSTYFPDCNHGMAMLALVELMASQGVSEADIYKFALVVNSYWFPSTYLTIAKLKASEGVSWVKVNPKEVLGYDFSSAIGYQKVLEKIAPAETKNGGGCGV